MAELIINCPGMPEIRQSLTTERVTVGRAEDADIFIAEKKASRKHLRIRPAENGGWIAEELGSSNGTRLGDQQILRRLLEDGDELFIGDTSIRFVGTSAAPASEAAPGAEAAPLVVVGGTLDVRAVTDTPAEAIPQGAQPAPEPETAGAPAGGESRRRPSNGKSSVAPRGGSKGLVFVIVAAAILVGEHFFLGAQADKAEQSSIEQQEYFAALRNVNDPVAEFEGQVGDFEDRYPQSRFLDSLHAHLRFARDRDEHERLVREDLKQLLAGAHELPASIVRTRLMDVMRKLPEDEAFVNEVRRHIAGLDRRREALDQERVDRLTHQLTIALNAGNPGKALRLLTSFRKASPGMTGPAVERLTPLEDRARKDLQRVYDEAWAAADAAKTPEGIRSALRAAYPALAGTPEGARIENRIRDSIRGSGDPDYPTNRPHSAGGPDTGPDSTRPTDPSVPGIGEDVLTLGERAQTLILGRSWLLGRKRLVEAISKVDRGRIKNEWERLLADTDRILALTKHLGAATKGEKPPQAKLSVGRVTVTAADADKVTWTSKDGQSVTTEWSDVEDVDVLTLLVPSRPTPEQRLGGAVLAADLSARKVMVQLLAPLFEKKQLVAEASSLVAWRLYGRSAPPEGGYQVYKGQILDQRGLERVQEQELIASHRARADVLLVQIAKQKVFKKLTKMKELRAELDKRRKYALLAIFNEKHYPYPANKSSKQYQSVQKEIDRRIDEVREIWDDPFKLSIKLKGQVGKLVGEYQTITAELERRGEDVRAIKEAIRPYAMYVGGEPLSVREFYLTEKERTRLEYNRWVMASYNPARLEYASSTERKQTLVTNEYRVMMGYQAQVRPGPASYEAIDGTSVVAILDAGRVLRLTPLRAVRVDNNLVKAARLHSLDMQKRGYFSHFSKPNPATGQGQTSPHERMQSAGYTGFGSSENIASGAGSPEAAHWMWRHSSGHHRNLISSWIDMGCGHAGRLWTQNFGMGGGGKAVIQPDTEIKPPLRGGMPRGR